MNAPLIQKTLEAAMEAKDPQIELIGEDAPFDPAQRQWLNGLLTGLSAIAASAAAGEEEAAPLTALGVFYGSQSGNCEALSKDMRKFAATQGFEADVRALNDV
ncbi:MAG: hypothetical protein AAF618_06740, partial [Pseudomonadota bacterium]